VQNLFCNWSAKFILPRLECKIYFARLKIDNALFLGMRPPPQGKQAQAMGNHKQWATTSNGQPQGIAPTDNGIPKCQNHY